MNTERAAPERIREWSEEVARDPASLAFLPLAVAYRAAGRNEAALRLCLRGLERHSTHVEAHHLLGELYRERGDAVRACDEWEIVLRLAPEHAGSRRSLGLLLAERGEWKRARRHLDLLAADGPLDEQAGAARTEARFRTGSFAPPSPPQPSPAPSAATGPVRGDPLERLHAALRGAGERAGFRGALLLDGRGDLLAGALRTEGGEPATTAGAALRGTVADAEQAARHLGLGAWRGILIESTAGAVRLAPVHGGLLAIAAERRIPPGWVLRITERLRREASAALDEAAPTEEVG